MIINTIIIGELSLLFLIILMRQMLKAHQSGRRKLAWYAHRRKTRRLEMGYSTAGAIFFAYTIISILVIIMTII